MGEGGYNGYSSHAAYELAMAIDKDPYSQKKLKYWINSYANYMKKGNYNRELAVQGIRNNFVPDVTAKIREKGGLTHPSYPREIKHEVAQRIVKNIEQQMRDVIKQDIAHERDKYPTCKPIVDKIATALDNPMSTNDVLNDYLTDLSICKSQDWRKSKTGVGKT